MHSTPVLTTVDRHVGQITLNRPDRRNALTPSMVTSILNALTAFEADDDVRVVLFRGAGTTFCSGLDLAHMRARVEETGVFDYGLMPELFEGVARHPKPTVAMVHGAAVAGGCELALHCDLRVGSPAACFAMPLAKLGLVVPVGAAERLVQTIGVAAARDMLLTGDFVHGARAESLGLLSRLVAEDQLERAVAEITTTLSAHSHSALRALKRVLNSFGPLLTEATRSELEAERQRMSANTDIAQRLNAFLERRSHTVPQPS